MLFRSVFADGGFDIVVGNPPYVRQELLGKINKEFYGKRFSKVGNGTADLYVYFYELGLSILKPAGYLSYITPNKWFKTKYGKELRHFLQPFDIQQIIDFFELKIFEDAATEPQIILIRNQEKNHDFEYLPVKLTQDFVERKLNPILIHKQNLQDSEWVFADDAVNNLLEKLQKNTISLDEYTKGGIKSGIKTGSNKAFIISEEIKNQIAKNNPQSNPFIKKYLEGSQIGHYHIKNENEYLLHITWDFEIEKHPSILKHLEQFKNELGNRPEVISKNYQWFCLSRFASDYWELFEKDKIVYIHTAIRHHFYYDKEKHFINNNAYIISNSDLFLSAWLNSKVFDFYKKLIFPAFGDASTDGRVRLNADKMANVPIPLLTESQKAPFIEKAELMLKLNKELYEKSQGFLSVVRSELFPATHGMTQSHAMSTNNTMSNWYNLTYEKFVSEIKKQKGGFKDLAQQMEWQGFFKENQLKAVALKEQIDATNSEIDEMVFGLYGLSQEEIAIVRG